MTIVANRPGIIGDLVFEAGQVIVNHDFAEKLLAFGYADEVSEPPAPDPTPVDVATKAQKGTQEEEQ